MFLREEKANAKVCEGGFCRFAGAVEVAALSVHNHGGDYAGSGIGFAADVASGVRAEIVAESGGADVTSSTKELARPSFAKGSRSRSNSRAQ